MLKIVDNQFQKVKKTSFTLKKLLLIVASIGLLSNNSSKAQVALNTTGDNPHSSAALDVDFIDKGLLIPRVALNSNTDVTTIPSPANSLIIYNTNASMVNGNGVGFYYWDAGAGKWMYLVTAQNGPGSTGQVLTSTGPGNNPQWTTLSVSGGGGNTGCSDCITMISPISNTSMTWANCAAYCRNGTWGGYSDWRMPTFEEAIDYTIKKVNTSLTGGTFPFTSHIWTSTNSSTSSTWVIFKESTGEVAGQPYDSNNRCRCVR